MRGFGRSTCGPAASNVEGEQSWQLPGLVGNNLAVTPETIGALVTAVAALGTTIVGWLRIHSDQREFESEQNAAQEMFESKQKAAQEKWFEQREEGRQKEIAGWQIEFLRDLVRMRQTSYPPVFETLGVVVSSGDVESQRLADESPARLLQAAKEITAHLYGPAGLLMSIESRGWMYSARREALKWHDGQDNHDELVTAFYYARRSLRLDLQLGDREEMETALKSIAKERHSSPTNDLQPPEEFTGGDAVQ